MFRNIKNFIQRGVHGWCPEDTWNLDHYLSRVISESCKYLAETTSGYPPELTYKKWKRILNKISEEIIATDKVDESFSKKLITGIKDVEEYKKELDKTLKKQKKALELFVRYFCNLWD